MDRPQFSHQLKGTLAVSSLGYYGIKLMNFQVWFLCEQKFCQVNTQQHDCWAMVNTFISNCHSVFQSSLPSLSHQPHGTFPIAQHSVMSVLCTLAILTGVASWFSFT